MLISSDFRNRYGKYILFATLFLLLLLKIYLFHWTVFQSVPLSSLWSYPQQFFSFHLPKIAIALFFAAFALIDRHWITVALSFLLDIWIIANLVYFRAYDSVLDIFAFSMAGNMKGWWGSVFFFMSIKDAVYLVLSCVYVAVYKVFSGGGNERGFLLSHSPSLHILSTLSVWNVIDIATHIIMMKRLSASRPTISIRSPMLCATLYLPIMLRGQ